MTPLCTIILQGFNRTFPCPSEASLVLISVAMVPHLASCFKGTFLLLLSAVYVCLPWLHYEPTMEAPCWFRRYVLALLLDSEQSVTRCSELCNVALVLIFRCQLPLMQSGILYVGNMIIIAHFRYIYRDGLHIQELIMASCVLLVASVALFSLTRQVSPTNCSATDQSKSMLTFLSVCNALLARIDVAYPVHQLGRHRRTERKGC